MGHSTTLATVQTASLIWRCPLGKWMRDTGATGTTADDTSFTGCPYECGAGFYGDDIARQSDATCSGSCPAGHFCGAGTIQPTPCPMGKYLPTTGASSLASCIECSPGSFSDVLGNNDTCVPCGVGTYTSDFGQTACAGVCGWVGGCVLVCVCVGGGQMHG